MAIQTVVPRDVAHCTSGGKPRPAVPILCVALTTTLTTVLLLLVSPSSQHQQSPIRALPEISQQLTTTLPQGIDTPQPAMQRTQTPLPTPTIESLNDHMNWSLPHRIAIRQHFADVVLVIFVSPSRYTLVDTVFDHYLPFFSRIAFVGPRPAFTTASGVHIRESAVGPSGRLQHLATIKTMEALANGQLMVHRERSSNGTVIRSLLDPVVDRVIGYLQVSDDLVMQPWALLPYNLSRPWSPRVGLGDIDRHTKVQDLSSVDRPPRKWYWWSKYRNTLKWGMTTFTKDFLDGARRAAASSPIALRKASRWPRLDAMSRPDDPRSTEEAASHPPFAVGSKPAFYGVIDLFYIPQRHWTRARGYLREMMTLNIHNEIAIPTALFAVSGLYDEVELLDVHNYWLTPHCGRALWSPRVSGFHRCPHNHPFAAILFDERQLAAMVDNSTFRERILRSDAFEAWESRKQT